MPDSSTTVTGTFHDTATSVITRLNLKSHFSNVFEPNDHIPSVADFLHEQAEAQNAIQAKAAQLGNLPGAPIGEIQVSPKGWYRSFAGADIYYGRGVGAFEVHGDIRAKYNAFHGMDGVLGLPLTDETTAPDTVGRYNHFQGGSIYWSPTTGPMMVRGTIRDVWAAQGWERGTLGYPIADEYRIGGLFPNDHPNVGWSLFENGAIVQNAEGTFQTLAADLSPGSLRCVLRAFFDREIHKSPENVGLHAPVETLEVSGYTYDFWHALPRMITFRLHGFHDNGLAPDTDFELDVRLRLSLTWSMGFGEPSSKTLVAALDWIQVSAHGLAPGSVAKEVADGVKGGFFRGGPDPDHPEVPDGAVFIASLPTGASQTGAGNIDVVDVLVTPQGGLQVLVAVGPNIGGNIGTVRQIFAQDAINSLVESQGCG